MLNESFKRRINIVSLSKDTVKKVSDLTISSEDTKNGKIIKWLDSSNKAVYEWDEDLTYGAHYHVIGEDGNTKIANANGETHFKPGDIFEWRND